MQSSRFEGFTHAQCKLKMAEVNVNVATCEDSHSSVVISEDSCSSNKTNSRQTKSDVWEFFIKQEKLALCKICNKEYAFHGGTSNLCDHLIRAVVWLQTFKHL